MTGTLSSSDLFSVSLPTSILEFVGRGLGFGNAFGTAQGGVQSPSKACCSCCKPEVGRSFGPDIFPRGLGGGTTVRRVQDTLFSPAAQNTVVAARGTETSTGSAKGDILRPGTESEPRQTAKEIFGEAATDIRNIFQNLSVDVDTTFKGLAKQLESQLISIGLKILDGFAPGLGTFAGGFLGFAGGGRVQPGRAVVVGERGPEIIVPSRPATIMNASDSRAHSKQLLSAVAAGPAASQAAAPSQANKTQVVVHNYSGEQTNQRRGRGPGGEELVEIIIGRVADDMASGGRTADAAGSRFGLTAQGR